MTNESIIQWDSNSKNKNGSRGKDLPIGLILKRIRMERKISLTEISQEIRITSSLLSQIEHAKAFPSLQSLQLILNFYGISLAEFFRQVEQADYLIQRFEEVECYYDKKSGIRICLLASKLFNNNLDSYLIEMDGGKSLEIPVQEKDNNRERFICVINGILQVIVEGKPETLKKMDSINFKSFIPVTIASAGKKNKTSVILSGQPPIFNPGKRFC